MHPLDLVKIYLQIYLIKIQVKTRLQIGGGHYNGLADCFSQTFKKEGIPGLIHFV